jgi:hypothetical protein
MDFLGQVWDWYTDPAIWYGLLVIRLHLVEHLSLSVS